MHSKNSNQTHIRNTLEASILHGLSLEWESASNVLSYSHSIKLKRPLFSLKPLINRLAYWDSTKREICFGSELVYHHSWGDVKDVLLHEMAHQLTSEFFKIHTESPHGKCFQKACSLLRANPKASGNYPPLSERILNPDTDQNDKLMFRIQKLLALAESNHKHEAEAAVAKAHQLIEKYNIDMLMNDVERDYVSMYIGEPALRHFREAYALANLIMEHYFVYGIWVSAYVLEKGKMGRALEISGTLHNVKIAAYVYDFVTNHINLSWQAYNKDGQFNRYRKTDFSTGIIEGLHSRLRAQKHKSESTPGNDKNSVPMKIEDTLLNEYTAFRYPHIRSFKRSASGVDEKIIKDGEKIGKKLVISKGLEKKATHSQRYLS